MDQNEVLPACSEEFWDAVITSGSPVAECELCHRTIYDVNGQDMDEGELEKLQWNHAKTPDRYVPVDGCVRYGHVAGFTIVYGCPCNLAYRYERFLWNHRWLIASFLKKKAGANLETARYDADKIAEIPEDLFFEPAERKRKFNDL